MRAVLSVRQQWGRRGAETGHGGLERNSCGICPHPMSFPSQSLGLPHSGPLSPCQADRGSSIAESPAIKRCWTGARPESSTGAWIAEKGNVPAQPCAGSRDSPHGPGTRRTMVVLRAGAGKDLIGEGAGRNVLPGKNEQSSHSAEQVPLNTLSPGIHPLFPHSGLFGIPQTPPMFLSP